VRQRVAGRGDPAAPPRRGCRVLVDGEPLLGDQPAHPTAHPLATGTVVDAEQAGEGGPRVRALAAEPEPLVVGHAPRLGEGVQDGRRAADPPVDPGPTEPTGAHLVLEAAAHELHLGGQRLAPAAERPRAP
jgi:hypothetical protein